MTEGSMTDGDQRSSMGRYSLAAAAVLVSLSIVGMTACDTVAQIPFSDRNFRTVLPVSMTPAGDSCDGISDRATMSMVLLDDSDEPIKLGEEVSLAFVEPEEGDFDFRDGRIYSLPNVECTEATEDEICPDGFRCVDNKCGKDSTIGAAVGDPRFVGEEPEQQALAVVLSEEGRWRGWYRHGDDSFQGLYAFDEETSANQRLETGPNQGAAIDSGGVRINALRQMTTDWDRLNDYVIEDEREAVFGLWTFREAIQDTRSQLTSGSSWTGSSGTVESSVDTLDYSINSDARADIYQSAIEVLTNGFELNDQVADTDHRSMVLIVGGHDERRRASAQDVIDKANEVDVEVTIIQIDPRRDTAPHILRDDPRYYEGESTCSDDSECSNYQACRHPHRYTDQAESTDPSDVVFPTDLSAQYCMPDYDENGRIGPIADFDRIACATGGAYHYIPVADESLILRALQAQVMAPEAAWEVDFHIDEFDALDASESYLLESRLDVNIGREQSYIFEDESSSPRDTRRPFFTPAE